MQINKEPECKIIKEQMKKNQEDWIKHFNHKGEKMISSPDIYKTAKKGNKTIIESLKKDFKDYWLVTSTRIIYNKDNTMSEIIHNVDSNIVKPKKYKVKIPIFNGDFKQDSTTEKYLQTLFDTKDNIDKIIKVLKKFGKDRELKIWTPDQDSRKRKQVRSVELFFNVFGGFGVGCCDWFGYDGGFSRGVVVDSAKQIKKTRGKSK